MIRLTTIASYGLCFSLWFFTGCSSSSDPKPFDCDKSDLDIGIASKTDPESCAVSNGSIEVSASGGDEPYTYSKDGTTFQSLATFISLGAGDFTIFVKDKNGCKKSVEVSLVIPGDNPLTAVSNVTPDTECLTNNGSVEIVASGGTEPYQYRKGNDSYGDNATFGPLAPGAYSFSVKDNANCVFTLSVTVTQGNTGITYTGQIKTIFEANCIGSTCHPSRADLFTYDNLNSSNDAKGLAAEIKSRTQSTDGGFRMPPSGGLSDQEKALIACWVDGGAPQ